MSVCFKTKPGSIEKIHKREKRNSRVQNLRASQFERPALSFQTSVKIFQLFTLSFSWAMYSARGL